MHTKPFHHGSAVFIKQRRAEEMKMAGMIRRRDYSP